MLSAASADHDDHEIVTLEVQAKVKQAFSSHRTLS